MLKQICRCATYATKLLLDPPSHPDAAQPCNGSAADEYAQTDRAGSRRAIWPLSQVLCSYCQRENESERIKDLNHAYLAMSATVMFPLSVFICYFLFLFFQIVPVHLLSIAIKSPQEIEEEVSSNMLRCPESIANVC